VRQFLGWLGLWLIGWRAVGDVPEDGRGVLIGHPHTSSFDLPIAILGTWALGVHMKFIAKQSLFDGPFGWLFRSFGGTGVDRSKSQDAVAQLVARFDEGGELLLGLAPSGTRHAGTYWRSGFYHIARAAQVPVAAGFLDYGTRRVGLAGLVDLTGDVHTDMERIRACYAGVLGRNPERQILICLAEEP